MRAVVFERPGVVESRELPMPVPREGEVVVKVAACGICGTDTHIYRGEYMSTYPLVGGHEMAGTIAAVGHGVGDWREGDRVTLDPNVFCGHCYFCKNNRANHCLNFAGIGVTVDGGFAEYVRVPARNVYALPTGLSFGEAALIEPVSCVIYALERIRMHPGSSVVVFGAGPMGQLMQRACQHSGAAVVTCVDLDVARLELARELGARNTVVAGPEAPEQLRQIAPHGFDVVIDATGSPAVVEALPRYAKPTAKILYFGVCPSDAKVLVSPYDIFKNDWEIYGSFALRYTFYPAIDFIESGAIRVLPIISHRISLEQLPGIFRGEPLPASDVGVGSRLKVLVRP